MTKSKRTTLHFNIELIFGEGGAFLIANATTFFVAHFTKNPTVIAWLAVGGSLAGGALFWLIAHVYGRVLTVPELEMKDLAKDISYFTPAALTFGFLVYQPALYFLSYYLLEKHVQPDLSVLTAQIISFCLFLCCMNIYRHALFKLKGKIL